MPPPTHAEVLAWLAPRPLQRFLTHLRQHSADQLSRGHEKTVLGVFLGQTSAGDLRQLLEHRLALYAAYPTPPWPSGSLASVAREASVKQLAAPASELSTQERRAAQEYLVRQSLLYYTPLSTLSWPDSIPSEEEFHLVFALVQAYATEALSLLLVKEVIDFLRLLIQNQSLRREYRQDARKLLLALFQQLIPRLPKQQPRAQTLDAYFWRRDLLVQYELEYARLRQVLKRRYHNPAARLLTLQEHYPHIPREQLDTWRPNQCATITQMLVGLPYGLTPAMVYKVLQQARTERGQRQLAYPPTDATQ